MYKPKGYTDLSPYLVVADGDTCLAFIQAVFGTAPLREHRGEDGRLIHGEIAVGDSIVMLGQSQTGAAAHLHVYLQDPDAAYERALAAGATAIDPMQDKPDGDRRGGVRAPCGTLWWLARSAP